MSFVPGLRLFFGGCFYLSAAVYTSGFGGSGRFCTMSMFC